MLHCITVKWGVKEQPRVCSLFVVLSVQTWDMMLLPCIRVGVKVTGRSGQVIDL